MQNSHQKNFLLLGAGFSRNWGGWLAAEADEYLLGHPQIDKSVRDILWQYRRKGGFEAALGHLQLENSGDPRLGKLQEALKQMFDDMDSAFKGIVFNFNNELKTTVTRFLTRFDAIFTLNQDLLLERHYHNDNLSLISNGRWSGFQIPGLSPLGGQTFQHDEIPLLIANDSIFQPVISGAQPYYKLHGSANWVNSQSTDLLVMGGNKAKIITRFPVLNWYHNEFKRMLSEANARLMIIGYGFGDDHINRTIQSCSTEAALKIFIVDPLGVDVIDKNRNATVYGPDKLVLDLWPSLIGASRRSLREIFGNDRVEYEKLNRFFDNS